MYANHRQCLNVLPSVTTEELIEHAKRIVVVQVRLHCEVRLLYRVLPIPSGILEEHDGKHHVNYNSLCSSGAEVRIVVEPSELLWFSLYLLITVIMVTY